MSYTWSDAPPPATPPAGALGRLRAILKGAALGLLVFGGLALLMLVRLVEAPVFGIRRPWTPWITQFVCRNAFRIIGMRHTVTGEQMRHPGAVVANHSSWMDIFALNARKRVYFVSKSEVAAWPGIGWLARATGTVFINRDRREAKAQAQVFEERLTAGHKLLFFPEGTSTDGQRVLPFKSTLFAAFFAEGLRDILHVQPVTVIFTAPEGEDPRFYAWWGDMDFGSHLFKVLSAPRQGSVEIVYHRPLKVADFDGRKELALAADAAVRGGFPVRKTVPASADPR